jgi:hypothetical protein
MVPQAAFEIFVCAKPTRRWELHRSISQYLGLMIKRRLIRPNRPSH